MNDALNNAQHRLIKASTELGIARNAHKYTKRGPAKVDAASRYEAARVAFRNAYREVEKLRS